MAQNKTMATDVDPNDYVKGVENPQRLADSVILMDMMARLTQQPAKMWGPTIIGYGTYHYKYESGHEGESFEAGFAPRKNELVIYLMGIIATQPALLEKLGKHRMGKACLYIKKLSDVDLDVLEQLITLSTKNLRKRYPKQ